MLAVINSQMWEVTAEYVMIISVLLSQLKSVVLALVEVVAAALNEVKMAVEVAVHTRKTAAAAVTSQVSPAELTPHLTLTTINIQLP